jgi:hypothetical protein
MHSMAYCALTQTACTAACALTHSGDTTACALTHSEDISSEKVAFQPYRMLYRALQVG